MRNLKVTVVGDGSVGKSAMLISYSTSSFPSEYVPTVFDNYAVNKMVDGKPYNMALWDTAGQEDYDRLRPLSYPATDVFLVCFDIANRDSFENIGPKWLPEISHYCPATPRLLVGCKSDLRSSRREDSCVTVNEAKKLCTDLQMCQYVETSALELKGLDLLFDVATKVAVMAAERAQKKSKSGFGIKKNKNKPLEILLPPVMPPAGFAPEIEVETCIKGEQWLAMLHDDISTDLSLILTSGEKVKAHTVILSSASSVFKRAIKVENYETRHKNDIQVDSVFSHPAFLKVDASDSSCVQIFFTDLIKPLVLKYALQFLYAGVIAFNEPPNDEMLDSLKQFSELFSLPYLKQTCENIENDEEELNPSIGTFLSDTTAAKIKELFFNSPQKADIKFIFEDKEVFAHKCLLSARNKIMAAMFDGRFLEGNTTHVTTIDMRKDRELDYDTFLILLEFLYTGHTPLDQGVDPVALLMLCDKYNVTRLANLCEIHLSKLVDSKCCKNIEKADIDVIGLLNLANLYNAPQLTKWCLHFISSNYLAFAPRLEWSQLSSTDLEHIEEHRWPPVDYLNEVQEYEVKMEAIKRREKSSGSSDVGCTVM
ncbi:rho-related protein racA-like [Watersipora subatra]|uniref:rho-related protein racA-like n=1 Tax=Watersipora subatra TaxID=2589382 RepID=UPI00355B9B0D